MSSASGVLELELPLDSEALAIVVEAALQVEADQAPPRTRCTLRRSGNVLRFRIEAEDTGSLRAGMNSYLRWAETALGVAKVASRGQHL